MKKLVVEFIENGIARCEDENKQFVEIEASRLPDGVKNGDVIAFDGEAFSVCEDETVSKKKKMLELQAKLFGKKS